MFCLFSYIRSASQDVIQPTWWTLTRKLLTLPIILIVTAYNKANLYINCWDWYHHALMLVWLFNKHEASAILLLICSLEVWVKVAYDWSMALYLCLWLCRPRFHWSKLRHKHKHKHKCLCAYTCAYAHAYVAVVFTCLHMRLCVCLCLCASEKRGLIQQRQQQQLYFTLKSLAVIKKGRRSISQHNPQLA